jgi:hypothetical protein
LTAVACSIIVASGSSAMSIAVTAGWVPLVVWA